ncbi:MAG TPA: cell division protein FtsJ [Elusimicrobiota bacterium]|nr:cell division protein FtsJ [Elusimicrobiota bacterium]
MKLFVDDWRSAPEGWETARSVPEAIERLRVGKVEEVSLDYVIGDDFENNFSPVARFIADMPESQRPKRVIIHTSSSEGARLLRRILEGRVERVLGSYDA